MTLHKDGTWTKFVVRDDKKEQIIKEKHSQFEVETLSDDEGERKFVMLSLLLLLYHELRETKVWWFYYIDVNIS